MARAALPAGGGRQATAGVTLSRLASLVRPANWLPTVLALAAVAGAWQLVASSTTAIIPTLGAIWSAFAGHTVALFANGGDTLAEALPGLAISYVVAIVLAVAMSQSRVVTRAVLPLAVALNVSPIIAFAPPLSIAFGLGRAPRVVLAAVITFFPSLINAIVGLGSADQGALEVFQTLHASRWETLWRLRLPASLPYLFAAARISAPLSLVGAAVAEMVLGGTNVGLGIWINTASANAQLNLAWARIAVLAFFGLLLTGLVAGLEAWVLKRRGFR